MMDPSPLIERLNEAIADRYVLRREIGRGGMAFVFLAEDLRHGRQVALKVLDPELTATLGAERFLREIEITAKLQHPHIVPLFDSGEADSLLFYVMPFVEGESLRDLLERERQLPLDEALKIIGEVGAALAYAHRHGVVHRDIKPANVMLAGGIAQVTDFGIARALREAGGERMTHTGLSIGSPAYMSPEQASGGDVDHRSDVYAMGCLLYEMLAGEPPFTGPTPQAVMARKVVETAPGLRAVRETIPPGVARAVQRSLARAPAERFQTATEFVQALQVGAAFARPRLRGALLATFGVVVAAGAIAWWVGRSPGMADETWARSEALPEIARLTDAGDVEAAYALAERAAAVIPGDPTLERLWWQVSLHANFRSHPPGAEVSWRPYGSEDAWKPLGVTPADSVRVPALMAELRYALPGYRTAEAAEWFPIFLAAVPSAVPVPLVVLEREDEGAEGWIRIRPPWGRVSVEGLTKAGTDLPLAVPSGEFWIARHEVTNAQFKAFVDAGGYEDPEYWEHPIESEGRTLSLAQAMERFTDRSGLRGPSTWEGGSYLPGRAEYPVGGVSWYEAAAYARFAGADLPTAYHWNTAAYVRGAEWIVPASNFSGQGPEPVGARRGLGRFGTVDMAGNVREWCWNTHGGEKLILGGGWDDHPWAFHNFYTQPALNRSSTNGIRLVRYAEGALSAEVAAEIRGSERDFSTEKPVPEDVFRYLLSQYDYDPAPLGAMVEATDSSHADWVQERASFDAAYGGERVSAQILLPRGAAPPYQVIVYFPGAFAMYAGTSDATLPIWSLWVDFIVRSGRAVVLPVLKRTFERRDDRTPPLNASESADYRDHVIMWAQDVRRTVDYVETRPDLDAEKAAFYGVSMGGYLGPIMLAVEPRFRAGVLHTTGLALARARPEADGLNFAPRVTVPVLLLNGRYDYYFPYETSQIPLFELLGTPSGQKELHVEDTGHTYPRAKTIRETLDWLDRFVGPVSRAP